MGDDSLYTEDYIDSPTEDLMMISVDDLAGNDNSSEANKANKTKRTRKTKRAKKTTQKLTFKTVIARIGIVLGSTLLMTLLFLLAVIFVLIKGPSVQARKLFTLSAYETSAIKWLPKLFMTTAQYDEIVNPSSAVDDYRELPMVAASSGESQADEGLIITEPIEIMDIKGGTYQGKLMIVHDPSKVFFGSIDSFGHVGLKLTEFIDKYGAIACTNAGGFEDEGGTGKGGIPDGIVIRDGAIAYGSQSATYRGLAGFDADHVLHVGDMTGQQALDLGIISGTNFSGGPVLIKDGVRENGFVSGINPRTAIGQREDGAVLLLALEGRMADSLGATFEDLTDIMQEYGAVNAVNMDGGSSSGMYYRGERITRSCSVVGDRPLPTAIIVME